jgi:uncharacterized protein (TIGR03435 family)
MKSERPDTRDILRRSWSSASEEQIDTASHRVLHHLRSRPAATGEESVENSIGVRRSGFRRVWTVCVAAAVLLSVLVAWAAIVRQPAVPLPAPVAQQPKELSPEDPERLALLLRPLPPGAVRLAPQNLIPQRPRFAVVSIKTYPPGTAYPDARAGVACRGVDGVQRMLFALRQNMDPVVVAPQGRCVAVGVLLPNLIRFAYGINDVSGGPDWASRPGGVLNTPDGVVYTSRSVFHIEAAADDPSKATTEQLKQMFQAMLVDRFSLKFHKEVQEGPGYALVVAENGPKLAKASGNPESPVRLFNEKGQEVIKGRSTLAELVKAQSFASPIVDKTGLSDVYEYEIVAPRSGGAGQRGAPGQAPPTPAERAEAWSAALEAQVGLRLQAEKSLPIQRFVIDQVELPSPN